MNELMRELAAIHRDRLIAGIGVGIAEFRADLAACGPAGAEMGADIHLVEDQFAGGLDALDREHEAPRLARAAIVVAGDAGQEVDVGRIQQAPYGQMAVVGHGVGVARLPKQVAVKGTGEAAPAGRLLDHAAPLEQVIGAQVGEERVVVDGGSVEQWVARHGGFASPALCLGGNLNPGAGQAGAAPSLGQCGIAAIPGAKPLTEGVPCRRAGVGQAPLLGAVADPLLRAAGVDHVPQHAIRMGPALNMLDDPPQHVSGIGPPAGGCHRRQPQIVLTVHLGGCDFAI